MRVGLCHCALPGDASLAVAVMPHTEHSITPPVRLDVAVWSPQLVHTHTHEYTHMDTQGRTVGMNEGMISQLWLTDFCLFVCYVFVYKSFICFIYSFREGRESLPYSCKDVVSQSAGDAVEWKHRAGDNINMNTLILSSIKRTLKELGKHKRQISRFLFTEVTITLLILV